MPSIFRRGTGCIEIQPQILIHLTLVERNLVTGAVVELGGARAFVRGYACVFEGAAGQR
jgi:hypothetical protein